MHLKNLLKNMFATPTFSEKKKSCHKDGVLLKCTPLYFIYLSLVPKVYILDPKRYNISNFWKCTAPATGFVHFFFFFLRVKIMGLVSRKCTLKAKVKWINLPVHFGRCYFYPKWLTWHFITSCTSSGIKLMNLIWTALNYIMYSSGQTWCPAKESWYICPLFKHPDVIF